MTVLILHTSDKKYLRLSADLIPRVGDTLRVNGQDRGKVTNVEWHYFTSNKQTTVEVFTT